MRCEILHRMKVPRLLRFVLAFPISLPALSSIGSCIHAQTPDRTNTAQPDRVPYSFHHVHIVAGGFITGVLFHPTVSGLAYVRTDIGGAYRWDAAKAHWTPLSEWIPASESNLIGIESMAVDPARPNDLYLAAGTYTHPGVPNGALLRSHDRGAHFEVIRLPFQLGGNEPGRFAGERLALDPNQPGNMYLGTRNDGLWHSADDGSTWARVENFPGQGTNGIGIVFIIFGPKGTDGADPRTKPVYAGVSTLTGPNLFVSTDAGSHWRPVEGAPTGLLPYHAAFTTDGTLYATYGNAPGPNDVSNGAVWKRTPEGRRMWQQITPESPSINPRGFAYAGLALDAHHPDTVVVSTLDRWQPGDTLFVSRDRGSHWTSLTESAVRDASASPYLVHEGKLPFGHWIGAVAIDPNNADHALYGTGETLWSSNDFQQVMNGKATHWTVGAEGIEETAVIHLLAPSSGAPLFAGLGDIGCFRADSVAAGKEATALEPPALSNCDAVAYAAAKPQTVAMVGRVWTGAHHGGYSLDGGHTWHAFASEPVGSVGGGSVALNADGSAFFWTTTGGSFLSRDRGEHWQRLSADGRAQLVTDPLNPRRAILLSREGGAPVELTLADGGGTPAQRPLPVKLAAGTHLLPDPQKQCIWLFGKGGLQVLERDGETPQTVSADARISAFAVGAPAVPNAPETLFFAGQLHGVDGIFRSSDKGRTWQHIDDPEHGFGYITVMAADPRVPGRVYLGTNGLGVLVADPAR